MAQGFGTVAHEVSIVNKEGLKSDSVMGSFAMARQREDRVGLGWMNDLRSIFLLKLDTYMLISREEGGKQTIEGAYSIH